MASQITGLGKGLAALIKETTTPQPEADVRFLPVKDIRPNPEQPRRHFADEALQELAASIKEQGILQPLLVRPVHSPTGTHYEIVAGERRWRASQLAGLFDVPVVVKSFSDQETLAAALVENMQREDLSPLEEAQALQTLRDAYALSQEELAHVLGKSRSAIANTLRLLALPASAQDALRRGELSSGHGRALLGITSQDAQEELCAMIIARSLSVREAEGLAALWKASGSFHVVTADQADALNPSAQAASDGSGHGVVAEELPADATDTAGAAPLPPKRARMPQSAAVQVTQQRLAEFLALPVKVTGSTDKGKISISYASAEELEELMALLASIRKAH